MSNITVLIVDDEAPVLKAISSVLRHEQIDAVCASDSTDAFACLARQTFDLILLDIMMPGQDGFSMLRELRERKILTPVILLSGRRRLGPGRGSWSRRGRLYDQAIQQGRAGLQDPCHRKAHTAVYPRRFFRRASACNRTGGSFHTAF